MVVPGAEALGRGVVVLVGKPLPSVFSHLAPVTINERELSDPAAVIHNLHMRWLRREPTAIVLAIDPQRLRMPETNQSEPYKLGPEFHFPLERLQFLVWANNYDWRGTEPVWWWARKAERAFAERSFQHQVELGGPADLLVDGTAVWCDGGPRQPFDADSLDGYGVVHRDSIEQGRLTLARHHRPGAELAPDQLAAVSHHVGPARIIAPAGSGKTRVLTERLRHLVSDRGWERETICAVAYNKRAAEEMTERTSNLGLNIRTLNSLGLAICNGTGGFARPANFSRRTVIEEPQVRNFVDQLTELRRAANTDPFVPYLEGLRAIRLALAEPKEVEVAFDAPGLADLFPRYLQLLNDNNAIDFDGQLYEAIRVLLTDPRARAQAQSMARHLLVDEFQDLTPAHLLLLRLMAAPAFDVFGVGDDDQVIYGFGGATPRFLLDFQQFFPGAAHHALEVNYRCPPLVVNAAVHLLSYNTERITKQIRTPEQRSATSEELSVRHITSMSEARATVDQLETWAKNAISYKQMAVLTRVNSTLLPVQLMAIQAGIACRAPLGEAILDRTGIRTALAYLRIGLAPQQLSRSDISETVRRPSRRISKNVIDMMTKRPTTDIGEIRRLSNYLSGGDKQKVADFARDLDRVATAVRTGDVGQVLRVIRVNIKLDDAMDVLDGSRREADRSTHTDDLAALEQVAELHRDPATFEAWLRSALRHRSTSEGVELSTIHRVKGREWDHVVVYGANEGLLPHRLAGDETEERRLLHVAITRARQSCVVIADAENPSPFLEELTGERPRNVEKPRQVTNSTTAAKNATKAPKKARSGGTALLHAEIGMSLRLRGYEGEIVELLDDLAVVAVDSAKMRVRFGETVEHLGASVVLAAPMSARQTNLVETLTQWRKETAKRDGVSSYVILSNDDVKTVAAADPLTLEQLAACRGMGPSRLERWGDEILSVIELSAKPLGPAGTLEPSKAAGPNVVHENPSSA